MTFATTVSHLRQEYTDNSSLWMEPDRRRSRSVVCTAVNYSASRLIGETATLSRVHVNCVCTFADTISISQGTFVASVAVVSTLPQGDGPRFERILSRCGLGRPPSLC